MKILVVVIHPDIHSSVFNKRWVEELQKFPEEFHLHQLHQRYPDERIEVEAEQKLLEKFDKIVFQFPFYWFNCPPFFKSRLDEELTYGWGFGKNRGYKLSGKKIALALSIGMAKKEYNKGENYKSIMDKVSRPFEMTSEYIRAHSTPFIGTCGIEQNSSDQTVDQSTKQTLEYLRQF